MKSIHVSEKNSISRTFIGYRGENKVTEVVFDYSAWVAEFGAGVIDLYVLRLGDSAAYPVVLSTDGGLATWLVTDTDTDKVGTVKGEYVFTVDEKVAKTCVLSFSVEEDIGKPVGDPPDPYQSWLDSLTELGTATEQNAQDAVAAKTAIDNMTASALVDANVGTPSVVVTKSTVDDHEHLHFEFHNIKGETGEVGIYYGTSTDVVNNPQNGDICFVYME